MSQFKGCVMKILNIIAWGDIDYEDYGVCSSCRKELYCCSCDGGI